MPVLPRQTGRSPDECEKPDPEYDQGCRLCTTICRSERKHEGEFLSLLAAPWQAPIVARKSHHLVYERCCGIDVHKRFVVACLCLLTPQGAIRKEIRTFTTMTGELLQMLDWLKQAGCTHVALESTGVSWRPIHNLLETELEVLLVNAQHIKAVPARPQRELRELTHSRTSLVGERSRLVNRIQKILEDTNIKLTSVVTDITGVSARAILGALLQGQTDPQTLASLARGRLRKKKDQIKEAVQGTLKDHHRFLLSQQLEHLDMRDAQIAAFDQEIAQRLESEPEPTEPEPFQQKEASPETAIENREPKEQTTVALQQGYQGYGQAMTILDAVTGINERIAQIIVAEIGIDMNHFPSEAHVASWVGLCPGTKISAGKRLSGKIPKGNSWLRQALIEAAHGAARSKGTYLGGLYQRLAKR